MLATSALVSAAYAWAWPYLLLLAVLFCCAALQVRTKVFKCLGCVVEADSRVMAMPEVAQAVNDAQGDDSAAVKEAVLELLVKLISTNPELASGYFDTLVQASYVSFFTVARGARALQSFSQPPQSITPVALACYPVLGSLVLEVGCWVLPCARGLASAAID